jgi:hypothetical protein
MIDGNETTIKQTLLSAVYDIPAKSYVMETAHHREGFACTRCLHPGEIVRTDKGIGYM